MLEIHDNMVEEVVADELERNMYDELDDPSKEEDTAGDILSRMEVSNKDDFSRSGNDAGYNFFFKEHS